MKRCLVLHSKENGEKDTEGGRPWKRMVAGGSEGGKCLGVGERTLKM